MIFLLVLFVRELEADIGYTMLFGFSYPVEIYKALVDFVITFNHLGNVILILILWVTHLLITTGLLKIRRLSGHQLTHLIDKLTLSARQKSQYCRGKDTLPMDELFQVKFLIHRRLGLQEELCETFFAAEFNVNKELIFYRSQKLEINLEALK